MYINSLSLANFRNYEQLDISFSPFTNVIYGNNAQGKTNILEALYLFSQGRSHRSKIDKELIRFGSDSARLGIKFSDAERDYRAVMQLQRSGKKSIKVNHIQLNKLSMLMNYLNIVMFSPEDLTLIKGAPSSRRRFIDAAISQLYPAYLISLSDYNKALLQKSSLLKTLKRTRDKAMLSVWNEQLSCEGAKIMHYRRDFIDLLNGFAQKVQSEISDENLVISYVPNIRSEDITEENFYKCLEMHQDREMDFATALYGVQRDDIAVMINGNNARVYGSQGQQRTATLAMKIAHSDYIHHIKGEYPVLLLDDIMSELDKSRREYLAERIRDKQVFITSTDTDTTKSTDKTKLFYVEAGTVREV